MWHFEGTFEEDEIIGECEFLTRLTPLPILRAASCDSFSPTGPYTPKTIKIFDPGSDPDLLMGDGTVNKTIEKIEKTVSICLFKNSRPDAPGYGTSDRKKRVRQFKPSHWMSFKVR